MKILLLLCSLVAAWSVQEALAGTAASHLVCYFNGESYAREGLSKFTVDDMEPALQFCTHLVYGYAGIGPGNKLVSLREKIDLDLGAGLYRTITGLKKKYPHLKILLSVGGDRDEVDPDNNKYLTLLESSNARIPFVNSAHSMLKTYGFDGLDVAWQFPKTKPKKEHSGAGRIWKGFKKLFTGDFVVDENAEQHKEEFTTFIGELKRALRPDGYILGISVLPNVNSSWYFNVPAIINNIDYVNLNAFDFSTPDRYKETADFPAPLYELSERNPEFNVHYQVQYWLNNNCPATKINVGIPTYGRAWKMTDDSGLTGVPPVPKCDGPAPEGLQTKTPGFLSWPEVCSKLPNPVNQHLKGADGPLRKVNDPTKRFGPYAYRAADESGENGIWVGYEDPDSAANKAGYVKLKGLGGVALYDLSNDDYRGSCTGDKFPILRAIKYKL